MDTVEAADPVLCERLLYNRYYGGRFLHVALELQPLRSMLHSNSLL